jgi:hypothetical protein
MTSRHSRLLKSGYSPSSATTKRWPGTSKWNKIEHRLFSFISVNWRGKPLTTYQVIVNLIAATTTAKGLRVKARLDPKAYPAGVKVSAADVDSVNLRPARFHGDWNYTVVPTVT